MAVADGVRPVRCDDIAAVLALWERARSAAASTPDTPETVARLLDTGPGSLLVAERGPGGTIVAERGPEPAIVGALIAAWDGWRGNMYRLAVRQGCRREGIGIALTRAGEEYLRRCGVRRVTALVAFDDEAAGAFWEAAGYPRDCEIGRRVRNL